MLNSSVQRISLIPIRIHTLKWFWIALIKLKFRLILILIHLSPSVSKKVPFNRTEATQSVSRDSVTPRLFPFAAFKRVPIFTSSYFSICGEITTGEIEKPSTVSLFSRAGETNYRIGALVTSRAARERIKYFTAAYTTTVNNERAS